jgi:alpha-ketoglutarate-dependent taurine dioxygenase
MIMTQATIIDNGIPRADIVKRAARLGAEIKNIKLSGDLSDETIGAINKVLLEHKVIFFRDQGHLDDAEQESFAIRLGKLVPHPTVGAIKGPHRFWSLIPAGVVDVPTNGIPTSLLLTPIRGYRCCAAS